MFDRNYAGDHRPRVYRTQQEKDIWHACVEDNEYRCPALAPDDVVVDIGAHIGGFAYRAWLNGSRRVYAYESNLHHYEGAAENLHDCDGVALYYAAVVRGDGHRAPQYYCHDWDTLGGAGPTIASVSLDEILAQTGPVRFLKIDCEGSEWPILYTAQRLGTVREIAGEYHLGASGPEVAHLPPLDPAALAAHLQGHGFVCAYDEPAALGLFRAVRQ